MTAKISRQFSFQSGTHFENQFIINNYDITLYMEILTEDSFLQTIAFERIKFIFYNKLENCVFVSSKEKKAIENYITAGINVCTLPDEPYDQVVAGVLLKKFNSIAEQKIHVYEIKIRSYMCDDIEFYINYDDQIDPITGTEGWWNNSDMSINNLPKFKNTVEKVIELKKEKVDWTNVNLSWKSKNNKSGQEIVVFTLDK